MQILAVDIGTGTQDILLYDSRIDIENCFKLILPSPTMMINKKIKEVSKRREAIVLTGVMMGGGPSHWAAEEHLRLGYPIYSTPDAARTFNDDLNLIEQMGITLVSVEEAEIIAKKDGYTKIIMQDFDFVSILRAFSIFGINLNNLYAVCVAVFDHGDSPSGYSDRQFRFDYLDERIKSKNHLSAFAYTLDDIPSIMTRLQSIKYSTIGIDTRVVVMDTAPAAVLGAMYDPLVYGNEQSIITNIGNFHTLAFRLSAEKIDGVFEHHTGLIDVNKLDNLITRLSDGSLKHEDVFNDHGHGALIYKQTPLNLSNLNPGIIVTGPRRKLMTSSIHPVHFAAPFGDMMITGCIGLLSATSVLLPESEDTITASLSGYGGSGTPPWELE